jgi:hypothetical protein
MMKKKVSKIEKSCFYDVDVILKERLDKDGDVEYLVSWKGYSSDKNSWIKKAWIINREHTNYIPNTQNLYMLATIACNEI